MLLQPLLCLLPSGREHHSSSHTQCSLPAQTDRLYFIHMCADIDRWRENYCAHKLKLWSRQFKKQNRKFRAKKPACVSQADERRRQKTHPLAWGGETQAHTCTQRPRFSSSILSNCLSEATCNWICQAPF